MSEQVTITTKDIIVMLAVLAIAMLIFSYVGNKITELQQGWSAKTPEAAYQIYNTTEPVLVYDNGVMTMTVEVKSRDSKKIDVYVLYELKDGGNNVINCKYTQIDKFSEDEITLYAELDEKQSLSGKMGFWSKDECTTPVFEEIKADGCAGMKSAYSSKLMDSCMNSFLGSVSELYISE